MLALTDRGEVANQLMMDKGQWYKIQQRKEGYQLLLAHTCTSIFNEIRARVRTFPFFFLCQRLILIARNVHELFFLNCGVSHYFYTACELDRESILLYTILTFVLR